MIFSNNEFKKRLQRRRQRDDDERRKKLEEEEKKALMLMAGIHAAQMLANLAQMMQISMHSYRQNKQDRRMRRYANSANAEHDAIANAIAREARATKEAPSPGAQAALMAPLLNASRVLQRRSEDSAPRALKMKR